MDSFIFDGCPKLKTAGPSSNNSTYNIYYGWTSKIPDYAFANSSLTSITIPSSITQYGTWCFAKCTGLTSIAIGANITSIGYGAFAECTGITSFSVNSSNTKYKSVDGVIFNKSGDTLVAYPAGKTASSYTIPSGVKTIGGYSIYGATKLTSLTIPEGVTTIQRNGINGCGITQIVLPPSVTSIMFSGVSRCASLSLIVVPDSITSVDPENFIQCASNLAVAVVEGSAAYNYCRTEDINYVLLPKIITNPIDYQGYLNSSCTFKVTASGSGLTYKWQYCLANGTQWFDLSSTSNTVSVTLLESNNGRKYRCKVTNQYGSTYSQAATLTVVSRAIITSEPDDLTVTAGDKVTLPVEAYALGATNLSYQWQVSKDDGSTFTDISVSKYPSAQTATLTFDATRTRNGYLYRVKITNSYGECEAYSQ